MHRFKIWKQEIESDTYNPAYHSSQSPCSKNKRDLDPILDELNSLYGYNALERTLNIEKTINLRESLIKKRRISRISAAYPQGHGIFYNEQGIPTYGKIPNPGQ